MKNSKIISKLIAATVIVSTVICFAGCKSTSVVASYKNDSVSAGSYIGFLVDSYYTATSKVSDSSSDVFSQKIDGKSAVNYIKDLAKASCREYLLINSLFDEYKLSFTAEETADFNNSIDQIWDYIKTTYENSGCGKESFKKNSLIDEKRNAVFKYYYGKDGVEPVADSVLKDYFEKNCAKIKVIELSYSEMFNVSTSADATDDQKAQIKAAADKYLSELKAGKSFDDIATEKAGEASSVDFTFIEKQADGENELNASLFALTVGTPEIIENSTNGYYIAQRFAFDSEGKDFEDHKDSVLSSVKGNDFSELISKKAADLAVSFNDAAVKRYSPKKLAF